MLLFFVNYRYTMDEFIFYDKTITLYIKNNQNELICLNFMQNNYYITHRLID